MLLTLLLAIRLSSKLKITAPEKQNADAEILDS
jgi:hypothetical protein